MCPAVWAGAFAGKYIYLNDFALPGTQGYLFISVLVNSNSELIRLINNAIKNDLASRNPTFMGLALHCIANVGSREMAEAFAGEIPKILVAGCVSEGSGLPFLSMLKPWVCDATYTGGLASQLCNGHVAYSEVRSRCAGSAEHGGTC